MNRLFLSGINQLDEILITLQSHNSMWTDAFAMIIYCLIIEVV